MSLVDTLHRIGITPVVPASFMPTTTDTLSAAYATWATDLITNKSAATIANSIRDAEASGAQVTVLIDVDEDTRDVCLFPLEACYVERSRGGSYRWCVYFWVDIDTKMTHCTILAPGQDLHYSSNSTVPLPMAAAFTFVEEIVRPWKELQVATVSKDSSVIDDLRGFQDMLNKSLRQQFVSGERIVLPVRVWNGFSGYDAETGEQLPAPRLNPATMSTDIVYPSSMDSEGNPRSVQELQVPTAGQFLDEQDAIRAAMARLASIPGFLLQLGGNPPSGDALEQVYMPFITAKAANERIYGPFLARLARLAVARYVYELTGGVSAHVPDFTTTFSSVSTSTLTSRVEHMRTAVEAGMTLADALVHFLGWSQEAADMAAENSAVQAAEQAAASAGMFDAGV